ncbi:MAG: glycoside hydrolase family 38 C-terminal domain-containing protein [Bacteroidota bacterium]
MTPPTYHIVSHSHWDREWYKSFQQFRAMLVNMVDDLLDLLQREKNFRCFTLDGQTIVLEDYLAVRPEREHELRKLIATGRLATGPWYILPDEFLVSAEATVRNLLVGTRMARAFGGGMAVGYIPDSFGHIAMMPAVLRGFGIDSALVYRGFGGEADQKTSEYWWRSPDGSRVLMVHLYSNGYSAGYFHDEPDEEIVRRFDALKAELDARATTSHRLLMNGGDHHWPDPRLPETLELLRKNFQGRFLHSSVQQYVDAVKGEASGLAEINGELRFGYRYAFAVLGGVYSSRMYIKQANWKSQNLLQRYAEPLSAMATAMGLKSQAPLVRKAWRTLMQNHTHDSICGCSIDAVHREMMTRFAASDQIANSVVDLSLGALVPEDERAAKDDRFLYFYNPSAFHRSEIAEAEARFYLQDIVVGLNPDVKTVPKLPRAAGFALVDPAGNQVPYQIVRREEVHDISYNRFNYPKQTWADSFTLLVDARDIPPLGFKGLRIDRKKGFAHPAQRLSSGSRFLENEFLRVEVNGRGEVTVRDKLRGTEYSGLNVFEDSGDVGDEYNYSYPKQDSTQLSKVGKAKIQRIEEGPLRASLRVEVTLRVPASAAPDRKSRSPRRVLLHITSELSITPYSRSVEFSTTVENSAKDHRLRVLFPVGVKTDRVQADSQFCIVERQQKSYDLRKFTIEHPAAVAPMQRFITVRGPQRALTLFAYGLPEYELKLDRKGTLALTLLRCVGLLAGDDLITRPGGKAGWHNETPEAQCQGVYTFRYAVLPHSPDAPAWGELIHRESERFHLPLLAFRRKHASAQPVQFSFGSVSGGLLVLSALKEPEEGAGAVVRLYNPGPAEVAGILRFAHPIARAEVAGLNEEPRGVLETKDGTTIPLRVPACGIMTVRIRWADGHK